LLSREQITSPPALPAGFAAEVIGLVNKERAAVGCPTLLPNDILMQVAQAHSQDMADRDFFDHTGADGHSMTQRMRDAGYRYARAAENLAAGVDSPAKVVALWMQSPGHRTNILNCQLRETGVGYVVDVHDPLDYGVYWTQDFGTR
ncbi:MAG: CAP domain-containing protein, partial [Chloroflexota bacterium]|nr:CAP domain-containing protein [Chloroflexota bacterium]